MLDRAAATRSRELFTLTVLVVALGIAVGSVQLFGVSMALGAFLAGMVVGRSEFSLRAATEALPMRDAFAVLFFVSVGHAVRPALPARIAGPGGGDAGGRPGRQAAGRPWRSCCSWATRSRVGDRGRGRDGPDRRVLVHPGRGRRATWASSTTGPRNALVAAAIVSITLNPLLYRLIGPLERCWRPVRQGARRPGRRADPRRDRGRETRARTGR